MLLRTSAVGRCERGSTYLIPRLEQDQRADVVTEPASSSSKQVDLRLAAALGWVSDSDICLAAQMSLLNCLCAAIPARERVITCEEVFELSMAPPVVLDCAAPPGLSVQWAGRRVQDEASG